MSSSAISLPPLSQGRADSSRWRSANRWGGLALVGAVAAAGVWASELSWARHFGLSALTLAIIFGLVVGNTLFPAVSHVTGEGVDFSKNTLLRLGVILYGLRITFAQLSTVGWAGVVIDAIMVALTYNIAVQLGTRVLGLDRQTAMLIGTGSAICGAAAVLASEPVVRAPPHKVSVAVATVVVFGTLGMFLYPVLYPYLALSPQSYGVYAGSTIHEVAQVVAAGRAVGDSAAATAVIEKMLRVMMLAPFLILLSRQIRSRDTEGGDRSEAQLPQAPRVTIPWFAFLFIVICGINSLGVLPSSAVSVLIEADTWLLTMAMAALGLRTHVGAIRQAGVRPLMLAAVLFVFLSVGGYGINRLVLAALG